MIRQQQAKYWGYTDMYTMMHELSLRLSTQAASHVNLGLPNVLNPKTGKYEANFELMRNISNLVNSELFGSILRTLMYSSAYITEIAPTINDGYVRDVRDITKLDTGTTMDPNEPIESAEHWQAIVLSALTGDNPVFTLDRASIGKTVGHDDEGRPIMIPQYHSQTRWRIKQTGQPSIRLELTGPGATSILPKIRVMALSQLIGTIGLIATIEKKDALQMVADMLRVDRKTDVWGDLTAGALDYNLNGPASLRMQTNIARARGVFKKVFADYNLLALTSNMEIAMRALIALQHEGNLESLAGGLGTLGGSMIDFARMGLYGSEVAMITNHFQTKEASHIVGWAHKRDQRRHRNSLKQYTEGKRGFSLAA